MKKIISLFLTILIMCSQMHCYASVSLTFGKTVNGSFEEISELNGGGVKLATEIYNDYGAGKSFDIRFDEYNGDVLIGSSQSRLYLDANVESTTYLTRSISSAATQVQAEITDGDTGRLLDVIWLSDSPWEKYPEAAAVLADASAYTSAEAHPRILIKGSDGISSLKQKINSDTLAQKWHLSIIGECDGLLGTEVCPYEDDDPRRILSANEVLSRLMKLSYAYRTTDSEAYLTRAVAEIENVLSWSDWNIYVEALNTSAICTGLSIAYDWLYDRLSQELKEDIRANIYNKAFKILLQKYPNNGIGWMSSETNWNFVCNSGFALTALTLFDEDGFYEDCEDILSHAITRLSAAIARLGDDGSWYEGVGYWDYAMEYFAMFLASLQSSAGSDYDYGKIRGIRNTGFFPVYMTGYKNQFNLNDSSAVPADAAPLMYFADRYMDGTMYSFRKAQLENRWAVPTVYDILWKGSDSDYIYSTVQDKFYGGDNQIAVFKSGGSALNAEQISGGERLQSAVMLHGGVNNVNHGHIDAGSFIYEASGVRWAIDSGAANYNLYNYFASADTEKSRWGYYKTRGEAHNTVIVNPGKSADQNLSALAEITTFESNENYGYAVVDMSGVLNLTHAQRGIYFDKLTGGLVVQDEMTLDKESVVYWMFNTDSTLSEISDNGKSAYITRGGAKLFVTILSDGAVFEKMDPAQILPTSPNPDEWEENINSTNASNPKLQQVYGRKLYIKLEGVSGNQTVSVYMAPVIDTSSDKPYGDIPDLKPISEWK